MKTLVLIDGNALIHRAYHALPPLKTKKGKLVNAVYGFISILFKVIKELKPDYLAATFDLAGPTFRDLEYKEYKAKRVKPPQELYDQIPLIKEMVRALEIPIYEKKAFEADDVIGTIVQKTKDKKIKSIIITGDLDTLQLVDKQTEIYTPKKGIKDIIVYDQAAIKKRYRLKPKQITDFKGLKGDPSDNIPGVPGIGEKTAIDLIKKFGSLKKLYQTLETSDLNPKLKAKLLEYKEQAFFSQYLATIKKDVPLDFNLEKCRWGRLNQGKVVKLLKKLEFNSLIGRLPEVEEKKLEKN
jgi:DNA polymerase-1